MLPYEVKKWVMLNNYIEHNSLKSITCLILRGIGLG